MNRALRYWWSAGFFIAWILYSFWWFYRRGTFGQFAGDVRYVRRIEACALALTNLARAPQGQSPRLAVVLIAASLVLNGFIYVGIGYVLAKVFGHRPVPRLFRLRF